MLESVIWCCVYLQNFILSFLLPHQLPRCNCIWNYRTHQLTDGPGSFWVAIATVVWGTQGREQEEHDYLSGVSFYQNTASQNA